jgi:dihydroorotase
VHLCRLSSAAALELVRAAKKEGLPVSCDVGVHHLHMTDADISFFDPNARLSPPLRSQRDRDAIRAAVLDGTVDAVCSDHTPVDDEEKLLPFGEASPGATGLELLLSLMLKWSVEERDAGKDAMSRALAKVTTHAARVAGLAAGDLSVGSSADVVLFDADTRWTVSRQALASQGKHTPFLGYELPGQVKATIVAGKVAFQR